MIQSGDRPESGPQRAGPVSGAGGRGQIVKMTRVLRPSMRHGGQQAGLGVIAAAVAGLAAMSAQAQQTTTPQEQAPAEATQSLTATTEAAKLADQLKHSEGKPVSFAEVIKHPDDVMLNYRYAQQQVREGDVKGAAGTLERILLLHPDLAQVRLFYAIVLYRLDNLDEAQRELQSVLGMPMPASLRAEVEGYLKQIALRRKRTRYSASFSVGAQYDSNRNAAPSSNHRLFIGMELPTQVARHDFAAVAIGSFAFHHDLGYQARHELFGSAVLYEDQQQDVQSQTIMATAFEFGGTYRSNLVNISPSVTYTYMTLHNEKFLHAEGVKLRLDRRLNPKTEIYLENHFQHQDFDAVRSTVDGIPVAPLAPDYTGNRLDSEIGLTYTFSPVNQITVGFTHTAKFAARKYYAFGGDDVHVRDTWLMGHGQFLLTSLELAQQRYDKPDPLVSPSARRDSIFRFRVTYGIPVMGLFPSLPLPDGLKDLTLNTSGELYTAHSNLTTYTYNSFKAEMLLTKRWEF